MPSSASSPAARRRQLYHLLGDLPPRRREIRVLERRPHHPSDGCEVDYIRFDFNGREPVPALYIRPSGRDGEALPAMLYNHWHGGDYPLGKNGFTHGFAGHPGLRPWAAELAALGVAGLCIDHWCFGERPSRQRGESAVAKEMLWRGQTLWGHMLYDSLRALDWLAAQPGIDAARLGTMGMSMGSTMAWWLAALDPRVTACVDICCLTEFDALIRAGHLDYHGIYYYVPGLLKQFTTGQINALIAPRPHLSLTGNLDELTPPDGLDPLDRELRSVYAAAGAPENWQLFRQEVGHCETPEMRQEIVAFLRQHLAQPCPGKGETKFIRRARPSSLS